MDLKEFTNLFDSKNYATKHYYDMTDANYRNFIYDVIRVIEPNHDKKGTILLSELDEVNSIVFVHKGDIGVGFEINKKKKIIFNFLHKCVIGAFYATYN